MTTYYIYEVPGAKIGATHQLKRRTKTNFNKYHADTIVLETYEMPDNEDSWQFIGDREWELADQYGYDRGKHYKVMRFQGAAGAKVSRSFHDPKNRHVFTPEELRYWQGKSMSKESSLKKSKALKGRPLPRKECPKCGKPIAANMLERHINKKVSCI